MSVAVRKRFFFEVTFDTKDYNIIPIGIELEYNDISNEKSDLDVFVLGKIGEIKDLEKKLTRGHSLPTLKQLGFEEKPTEKEHIIETTQEIKIETKQIITEKPKGDSEIERLKNELKDIENQLKHL